MRDDPVRRGPDPEWGGEGSYARDARAKITVEKTIDPTTHAYAEYSLRASRSYPLPLASDGARPDVTRGPSPLSRLWLCHPGTSTPLSSVRVAARAGVTTLLRPVPRIPGSQRVASCNHSGRGGCHHGRLPGHHRPRPLQQLERRNEGGARDREAD